MSILHLNIICSGKKKKTFDVRYSKSNLIVTDRLNVIIEEKYRKIM